MKYLLLLIRLIVIVPMVFSSILLNFNIYGLQDTTTPKKLTNNIITPYNTNCCNDISDTQIQKPAHTKLLPSTSDNPVSTMPKKLTNSYVGSVHNVPTADNNQVKKVSTTKPSITTAAPTTAPTTPVTSSLVHNVPTADNSQVKKVDIIKPSKLEDINKKPKQNFSDIIQNNINKIFNLEPISVNYGQDKKIDMASNSLADLADLAKIQKIIDKVLS